MFICTRHYIMNSNYAKKLGKGTNNSALVVIFFLAVGNFCKDAICKIQFSDLYPNVSGSWKNFFDCSL